MNYNELISFLDKENENKRIKPECGVEYLDTCLISPTGSMPRGATVHALSACLNSYGFFDPIIIDGSLNIIDGAKRYYAATLSGLRSVPVTFSLSYPFFSDYVILLAKSTDDFFEKADLLSLLSKKFFIPRDILAEKFCCTVSAISNKIRLASLSIDVRYSISNYGLSERHARSLLRLPSDHHLEAAEHIGKNAFTVAETEEYIDLLVDKQHIPFEAVARKIGISIANVCKTIDKSNYRCELVRRDGTDSVTYSLTLFE